LLVCSAAAVAVAGCGAEKRDFKATAQQACVDARAHAGTTAATVAAANATAVETVRSLHAPAGKADQARTLVADLDQQQHALAGLRDGLARHASATKLRDLTGAVDTQGALAAPPAKALGVPACGTAPAALVDRLQAEDYATQVLSSAGRFDDLMARLPHLDAAQPRAALRAGADRASGLFDPISDRLYDLDPPQRFVDLQRHLQERLDDSGNDYNEISEALDNKGAPPLVARRVARAHENLVRARADWHALRAALPRVPARSVWGSTAVRVSAAEAHDEYDTVLQAELYHLAYKELPRNIRRWQDWRRVARDIAAQQRRVAKLDAPPDARSAQRMLVSALHNAGIAYTAITAALEHHSRAAAHRAEVAAHVADQDRREAQRRYRGAHYDVTLEELSMSQDDTMYYGERVHG
jgi:hypothetical protein